MAQAPSQSFFYSKLIYLFWIMCLKAEIEPKRAIVGIGLCDCDFEQVLGPKLANTVATYLLWLSEFKWWET